MVAIFWILKPITELREQGDPDVQKYSLVSPNLTSMHARRCASKYRLQIFLERVTLNTDTFDQNENVTNNN